MLQEFERSARESIPEFGMSNEEVKSYQVKSFWSKLSYYFLRIEPTLVRIFNTIVYWKIKIEKAFISSAFRMILGKEV